MLSVATNCSALVLVVAVGVAIGLFLGGGMLALANVITKRYSWSLMHFSKQTFIGLCMNLVITNLALALVKCMCVQGARASD